MEFNINISEEIEKEGIVSGEISFLGKEFHCRQSFFLF
jgi:hypothetical protein